VELTEAKRVENVKVFKGNQFVGTLERTLGGCRFTYSENALVAQNSVCYSMPVSRDSYELNGVNLFPFFAGLLPEGKRLQALVSRVKTSEDDLFSLLVASGQSTIGDVWVSHEGTQTSDVEVESFADSTFDSLYRRVLEAEDFSTLASEGTIAGVQPKISNTRGILPVNLKDKTANYLLKLESPDHPFLIQNEFFFMNMAKDCGLEVAKVMLVKDKKGVQGLAVERFDRTFNRKMKSFDMHHQEDACQLMNRYPGDKYRMSYREIAERIFEVVSAPTVDVLNLLRLYAFSYLIGNGDLHAKNISVMKRAGDERIFLSPVYDLLTTLPYGDNRMALKLEGRDENVKESHLLEFGGRLGVPQRAVKTMLSKMLKKAQPYFEKTHVIGFSESKTLHLQKLMQRRSNDLES
jgi:serine/threonine-protein kinase HipA